MFKNLFKSLSFERKEAVLQELKRDSSPGFDFFILITLSCAIATFGLITDSSAVIIGAMLVAPLMSPILGLSLASVVGEQQMYKKAAIALLEGATLAIILSTLVSLFAYSLPFGALQDIPVEVIVRTRPSPFDLGIALAGGAAAAYALAQPQLYEALPGVAISTALMPPLCTIGIGIAIQNISIALGATLLFLTNLAAISFVGILVFLLLGYRPLDINYRYNRFSRSIFISAALVLIIAIPLFILSIRFVQEANLSKTIRETVATELSYLGETQLEDLNYTLSGAVLELDISVRTSRSLTYQEVVDLQSAIAAKLDRTVALQLNVVPITKLDPLVPPTHTSTPTPGPSATPTITPTFTTSPTQTASATPTLKETLTQTPTITNTPIFANISGPGGYGVYVRDSANGSISFTLPNDAPVYVLDNREVIDGITWAEITDVLGRMGWVSTQYIKIAP